MVSYSTFFTPSTCAPTLLRQQELQRKKGKKKKFLQTSRPCNKELRSNKSSRISSYKDEKKRIKGEGNIEISWNDIEKRDQTGFGHLARGLRAGGIEGRGQIRKVADYPL